MKHFLPLFLLFCISAAAQPLSVGIHEIDATRLPLIQLQVCLFQDNIPLQHPGLAAITLTENGVPMAVDVSCPDSANINSIAMVLDNSGSMSGISIASLKTSASQFVDSLRVQDEAAVYTFLSGGMRIQDFTSDKVLLKNVISAITAAGSTPLYHTTILALNDLALRPGRRICIVFTDGVDNSSSESYLDCIAVAKAAGITVYTIGYGNTSLSDEQLSALAVETGGRYYRIFSSSEIAGVFADIAGEVFIPCCTVSYTATSCTDSLRHIHLDALSFGQNAFADTMYVSPFRSDTLTLRVVAPPEVTPNGNAIVYFKLDPGVHTGLKVSFRFLVRYDASLIEANPTIPITVGTITQNTFVQLRSTGRGVLQFSGNNLTPGMANGNLVGIRFRGLSADSSRPVIITIDSLEFTAGCPNTVFAFSDTIDVCQCKREVLAWLPLLQVASSPDELRVPVFLADTVFDGSPIIFSSELFYNPLRLEPVGVETAGSLSEQASIRWDILSPGRMRVVASPSFQASGKTILFFVVFKALPGFVVEKSPLVLPTVKAYARCCPVIGPDTSGTVLVNGICSRVVSRRQGVTLQPNRPNPFNTSTTLEYIVDEETHLMLSIYDIRGNRIETLVEGNVLPGTYTVVFKASKLPSGMYCAVLSTPWQIVTRVLVVGK